MNGFIKIYRIVSKYFRLKIGWELIFEGKKTEGLYFYQLWSLEIGSVNDTPSMLIFKNKSL
jgi:hypothetical protein